MLAQLTTNVPASPNSLAYAWQVGLAVVTVRPQLAMVRRNAEIRAGALTTAQEPSGASWIASTQPIASLVTLVPMVAAHLRPGTPRAYFGVNASFRNLAVVPEMFAP